MRWESFSRRLIGRLLRDERDVSTSVSQPDPTGSAIALSPEISQRILLEELEQRLLLSADLNPVAGTIDVPGETDLFVFTLDEQKTLYFDTQTSVAGLTWSLTGPSGQEVTARALGTTDTADASPLLTLASGDYKLSVSGIGTATGAYRFRLMDLANATQIQSDTTVEGQLFPGTSTNLYSFAAAPGDHVFLNQISGGGIDADLKVRLFDHNGTQVIHGDFRDLDLQSLVLGGNYTLAVEGGAGNSTLAAYSFSISPVIDTQTATALDVITSGTVAEPGQRNTFTFTLAADTSIYFNSLTADANLTWSLKGPRGVERTGVSFAASDADGAAGSNSLLNLAAGSYTLTTSGVGGHVGTFSFRLATLPPATSVSLGQSVSATLNTPNATRLFKFDVAARDTITVNLLSLTGETPYWRLFDGYGRQIWAGAVASGSQVLAGAPSTGTYTLAIEGRVGATAPAAASFQINKGQPVAAQPSGTNVALGALINGNLTAANPVLRYSFDLTSATKLYFETTGATTGTNWTLTGPRGTEVLNYPFASSASNTVPDPNRVLDLVAGSYTLTVATTGQLSGNGFNFRLSDFATAQTLTLNQATTFTPSGLGTKLYKFDATAGEHFYFDYVSYNGSFFGPANWLVFDGYGKQVASATFTGFEFDIASMPTTGTYTLVIQGANGAATFGVYRSGGVNTPLTLGTAVTGATTRPGQVDSYTFNLSQDTEIFFDVLAPYSGNLKWSLAGPRGVEVVNQELYNDGSVLKLVAGDYTLSFRAAGAQVGSYAFRLFNLANTTPINLGTAVSDTLDLPAGTKVYSFAATAGEHLYFNSLNYSGSANYRLIDPNGRQVFQQPTYNDQNVVSLGATGTYRIVVDGYQYNSTAPSYSFAVRRVIDQAAPLVMGERIDATIQPGQENRYTFTLAAESTIYLDSLAYNNSPPLLIYGPSGLVIGFHASNTVNTPLTLAAGTYTISIKSESSQSGSLSFRLLNFAAAPSLVSDQAGALALSYPTGAVIYNVEATAGQRLYLDKMMATGGTATWSLYDPFDRYVNSSNFGSFPSYSLSPLAVSGSYRLIIEGAISNTAATSVSFTGGIPTPTTTAITLGQLVTGANTQPGQRNDYTFTLATETRLYFDSLTNDSAFIWGLAGPSGPLFSSGNSPATYGGNVNFQSSEGYNWLPAGNYTISVYNTAGKLGSHSFRLLDSDPAIAAPITLNTTISGTLTPGNSATFYSVDVAAGDHLYFDRANNGAWTISVFDKYGASVGSNTNDIEVVSAPNSGKYLIAVVGTNTNTGPTSYSFTAHKVIDATTAISLGNTVNGAIAKPGQTQNHTFTVANAGLYYLDGLANVSNATWTLTGPRGTEASAVPVNQSDRVVAASLFSRRQLHAGGEGRRRRHAELQLSGSRSVDGNARFRWGNRFPAPCRRAARPTFTSWPRSGRRQLQLCAPGGVGRRRWNSSVRLIDPYGNVVVARSLDTTTTTMNALLTGNYTLLIEGPVGAAGAIDYTFFTSFLGHTDPPVLTGTPLTLNAVTSGTIATPAQVNTYTFTISEARQLAVQEHDVHQQSRMEPDRTARAGSVVYKFRT